MHKSYKMGATDRSKMANVESVTIYLFSIFPYTWEVESKTIFTNSSVLMWNYLLLFWEGYLC